MSQTNPPLPANNLFIALHSFVSAATQIVATLPRQLSHEFSRGWNRGNIAYTQQFYAAFHNVKIVHTLSAQLGWSNLSQRPTSKLKKQLANDH